MSADRKTQSGNGPGLNLLFSKMSEMGTNTIPPVTLIVLMGKILQYQGVIRLPWDKMDICISADTALYEKDFKRFIFSVFEHADERDLYFNMISFLLKGRTLESHYGSANFALLLFVIIILANTSYVAMAVIGSKVLKDDAMTSYCAIGFSGVVFALKVVTTVETGTGTAFIAGFEVPTKYVVWAELIAIRQMVPSSSTLSQASGILAGYVYIGTPVGLLVDAVIATLTGSFIKDLPYLSTRMPVNAVPNVRKVRNKSKSRKAKG